MILNQKADPNAYLPVVGIQPLHHACLPAIVVAMLLEAKADANGKDITNWTPLCKAILSTQTNPEYTESYQTVDLLVKAKADIYSKRSQDSLSPLDWAKRFQNNTLKNLLLNGSDNSIGQSKLNKNPNKSTCLIQ